MFLEGIVGGTAASPGLTRRVFADSEKTAGLGGLQSKGVSPSQDKIASRDGPAEDEEDQIGRDLLSP